MADLTVIGGGLGGYCAALRAAQRGKKVTLIEKKKLGGTCLNVGCIPTKALLYSSGLYAKTRHFEELGLSLDGVGFQWPKVLEYKSSIVSRLTGGVEILLKKSGVEVVKGTARFTGPKVVEVEGREYSAPHVLLATGSQPAMLPFLKGLPKSKVITSDDVFELPALPKHLTVIGAGAIGIEIGSVMARFGAEVHIVEIMDQILPKSDKEQAKALTKLLKKQGLKVHTSTAVVGVVEKGEGLEVTIKEGDVESSFSTDLLLASTGRIPLTQELNLGAAGVTTDSKGFVKTDEKFFVNGWLLAVGDVRGGKLLAHKAVHEGLYAMENLYGDGNRRVIEDALIPDVVYSEPELASVGLTEEEAKALYGEQVKIGRFPLMANGRSLIQREAEGQMKVVFGEGKLVGASLLAPAAGEMIAGIGAMVGAKMDYHRVEEVIFPHPTVAESIGEAFMNAFGEALHTVNR